MDLENPKTWIGSVLAALAGLFAWSVKRQMDNFDDGRDETAKLLKEHGQRLHKLEVEVATRSDIDRLHTHINTLSDRMNTQHIQLLNAVARRE